MHCADFISTAFDGLGQDIWKVPFEHITSMLQVSRPVNNLLPSAASNLKLKIVLLDL